jgi:hypothetical protein
MRCRSEKGGPRAAIELPEFSGHLQPKSCYENGMARAGQRMEERWVEACCCTERVWVVDKRAEVLVSSLAGGRNAKIPEHIFRDLCT